MSQSYDLIVKGGMVYTPGGLQQLDIAIVGNKIAALGQLASAPAAERIDAKGLTVLPGVVDTQVHFREPGMEHKEDLESGTKAAILGGVTAVCEMPNTSPTTISATAIRDKLRRAEGRTWCDHAFFVGAAAENVDRLAELERLPGVVGVKLFMGSSTGPLLVEDNATLEAVLRAGNRRMAIHSEDEPRLRARMALASHGGPAQHPVWRDAETARLATERLLRLARKVGRRIHVLHITTADELPLLAAHRDVATVEVTPQHLTLEAPDCYETLGTYAQMNPPIRDAQHRKALWAAVANGLVDVIGSDHAPHTKAEKARPYPASPSGMPGVQTLLPLLLDHMSAGRLSLQRLVDLTSAGPQRIYGLADRGRIAQGYRADLTLVDLEAHRRIEASWLASRCGWSPFEGRYVTGWPMMTILNGKAAMRDGQVIGRPQGKPIRFVETLAGET
ncbi:MAG: dihydroorotase [Rhodospirillales bacterium]|nr:dihydroorotase [Rhodospirillales bacterium]